MDINLTERPRKLSDVVGQELVTETLKQEIAAKSVPSSIILEGHFGCGKTTTANILALWANCENEGEEPCCTCDSCKAIINGASPDVININASRETRKDDIVQRVIDESAFLPRGRRKVFIIDECQSLSSGAWGALLKLLEEPPQTCLYLFCTTNAEKIPDAIVSRSQVLHFRAIPQAVMVEALAGISKAHGWDVPEEILTVIAVHARGAMRDAKKYLQLLCTSEISMENCERLFNGDFTEQDQELLLAVKNNDSQKMITTLLSISAAGITDFAQLFGKYTRVVSEAVKAKYGLYASSLEVVGILREEPLAKLIELGNALEDLSAQMKYQNSVDHGLIGLLTIGQKAEDTELSSKVEKLEKTVEVLSEQVRSLQAGARPVVEQEMPDVSLAMEEMSDSPAEEWVPSECPQEEVEEPEDEVCLAGLSALSEQQKGKEAEESEEDFFSNFDFF